MLNLDALLLLAGLATVHVDDEVVLTYGPADVIIADIPENGNSLPDNDLDDLSYSIN